MKPINDRYIMELEKLPTVEEQISKMRKDLRSREYVTEHIANGDFTPLVEEWFVKNNELIQEMTSADSRGEDPWC